MNQSIVVIGGGASGLVAAITAARFGAKVTILEQNSKLGKKVLSTGNGKCNMTNQNQDLSYYRSDHPVFIQTVLSRFSYEDTINFFEELGIMTKNKNGYIYPRSNQAASVVDVLETEARSLKIKCKTQEEVISIDRNENGFIVHTKTWHYECDKIIMACGSKASVVEGSNGSGYTLARELGHSIEEPLPALTGLKGRDNWFSKWSGVRCDGKIEIYVDSKCKASDSGELQLTEYGISGIPVFQVSRYASKALYKGKNVSVVLDFLPELNEMEVITLLERKLERLGEKNFQKILIGIFPTKLIDVLVRKCESIQELTRNIKHFHLPIKDTMDYSHAQICTGGISLEEVDESSLESKLVPGVYFCGELLDVDGACGGYNLQWAWSSGYLAGFSAAKGD